VDVNHAAAIVLQALSETCKMLAALVYTCAWGIEQLADWLESA
jgi:hypothetical protein